MRRPCQPPPNPSMRHRLRRLRRAPQATMRDGAPRAEVPPAQTSVRQQCRQRRHHRPAPIRAAHAAVLRRAAVIDQTTRAEVPPAQTPVRKMRRQSRHHGPRPSRPAHAAGFRQTAARPAPALRAALIGRSLRGIGREPHGKEGVEPGATSPPPLPDKPPSTPSTRAIDPHAQATLTSGTDGEAHGPRALSAVKRRDRRNLGPAIPAEPPRRAPCRPAARAREARTRAALSGRADGRARGPPASLGEGLRSAPSLARSRHPCRQLFVAGRSGD